MQSFTIEFTGDKPMYLQLYSHLVNEITYGNLKSGTKLPSKLTLASHLGVSRNTVDGAYQLLLAEGYVYSKERSGYYVSTTDTLTPFIPTANEKTPRPLPTYKYDFSTTAIDTSYFPYKTWNRISREVSSNPELLNHGNPLGDRELRCAVKNYLHECRGIICDYSQIIIGAGMEYLLGLLSQMIGKDSPVVAFETPGYSKSPKIFQNNGLSCTFIPVRDDGIDLNILKESNPDIVYVTPSHQFPTGSFIPASNRISLIKWANNNNKLIIEDDYDSDFRFDGKPLPTLQSLDSDGRVIYLGTFSKTIAPSIRIAYMVLPLRLMNLYENKFSFYSSTVSRFEQHTLAKFISDGHFLRHLNKVRNIYKNRRNLLVGALTDEIPNIKIFGAHTGTHMLVEFDTQKSECDIVNELIKKDVFITGLSSYNLTKSLQIGAKFVLGYSSLSPDEYKNIAQIIHSVL